MEVKKKDETNTFYRILVNYFENLIENLKRKRKKPHITWKFEEQRMKQTKKSSPLKT